MKVHFDKEAKGNAEMAYGTGTGNYLPFTLKGYIERRKSKGKMTTKLKVNKNYFPPNSCSSLYTCIFLNMESSGRNVV